ncbi:MAG: hypothetical protein OHK0039_30730 [Bacteroidia bacterium]
MKHYPYFLLHFLLLCLCVVGADLAAQPDTDIYVMDLEEVDGEWYFRQPLNITPRKGYDNQPSFTPDGRGLLFVSMQGNNQTDVFRYDFRAGTARRLTETKQVSEYSPQMMPEGTHFSVVMVEADSVQRLWAYPVEGGSARLLTKKVDSIGYYAWLSEKQLATFRLGEPPHLDVFDVKRQKLRTISPRVGRSIHRVPGTGLLSYASEGADGTWQIYTWDPLTGETQAVVQTFSGVEDYCWTPQGYLLMGQGEMLYMYRPGIDEAWMLMGSPGVGPFYRLAMSPDGRKLAVVVYRGEKP